MPEFKYRDYYSVFGLENAEFVTPADATGLDAILEKMSTYERPGVEEVKGRLLASFPFGAGYSSPKATGTWGQVLGGDALWYKSYRRVAEGPPWRAAGD